MARLRYQLAVGRHSLISDTFNTVLVPDNARSLEEARNALVRADAPPPTPRFSGNVAGIENLLDRLADQPGEGAIVETQDMNVVAAALHNNLAGVHCGGDKDLEKLVKLLARPEARDVEIRQMRPFSRLNITTGKEGANSRLAAIYNHSFHIYPAAEEGCEDALEVRFIEPNGAILRYERFLEYGLKELNQYIERAVKLGGQRRLKVNALAEDDPVVFWSCVYRYRAIFTTLATISGDQSWAEGFRDAVHEGAAKAGSKVEEEGESSANNVSFADLPALLNEDTHKGLAETGFLAGIRLVLTMGKGKARPGSTSLEMPEGMRGTPLARAVQVVTGSGGANRQASAQEERARQSAELSTCAKAMDPSNSAGARGSERVGSTPSHGHRSLCAACGKIEGVRGQYKRCGRCKASQVKYCGRACQRTHWNDGHKLVCRDGAPVAATPRPSDTAVQVMVFPGDGAAPYAAWVPGTTRAEHIAHISTVLLKQPTTTSSEEGKAEELVTTPARLGGTAAIKGIELLHWRRACGPPNMRACCVATRGQSAEIGICTFAVGDTNPAVAVRGDAVVIRLSSRQGENTSIHLENFSPADYEALWGVFTHVMPGEDGSEESARSGESLGIVASADADEQLVQDMVRHMRSGHAGSAAAMECMRKLYNLS